MTELNNSKLLTNSVVPNANLRKKFSNSGNKPTPFELASSVLDDKRKGDIESTPESKRQGKVLMMKYKFIIALKKIKLTVVTFCGLDEGNIEFDAINPDDPLTPLPPSVSKKNDHYLLDFQNGDKYLILKSENAIFVQNYIELFDAIYTLQNQMIRSDFNKSYEFAQETAKKLKITIESPSPKKSKKAIVSEFWKEQVTEKINQLINQSKKIQVFLNQIKLENKYFTTSNNSANPRNRQTYPLCDTDLLDDFLEFINASIKNCTDQAGIIDKPILELLRHRYNYEYGNYVLRFSDGKVIGHPPISTDKKKTEFFTADELFELDHAINKFHQLYSGFQTIESDLIEIRDNPSLVEFVKYPNKDTRELLFLQHNLEKFAKLFSIQLPICKDQRTNEFNVELLLEFWTRLDSEIKKFVPLSKKAKQMYNRFDIVVNEADQSQNDQIQYPLFDLVILAKFAIFIKDQIIKLKTVCT